MSLMIPPALQFPHPKPLRTPEEIAEATGRLPEWRTSDFVLTYTKGELKTFAVMLAAGRSAGHALKFALGHKRYEMIGGKLAKGVEAARLQQLPEVKSAISAARSQARRDALMDMTERRGHCARIARKRSTPPASVIQAVLADARLAGELDEGPKLDVTINTVLASLSGTIGLPSDDERRMLAAKAVSGAAVSLPGAGDEVPATAGEDRPGGRRVMAAAVIDESDCVDCGTVGQRDGGGSREQVRGPFEVG
jgi:hypothetical protein